MDLESERSVEDRELLETVTLGENGEIDAGLKDNGNRDAEKADGKLLDDVKASPVVKTGVLLGGSMPVTKGRGLRKWRRIPRESGKETSGSLDSNRKRGLIAIPVGMKPTSEGSGSSTNAMSTVHGKALDLTPLNADLGQGPAFSADAARTDSENSEDRNSRSSTAASAPGANHKIPCVGLGLDTDTVRTLGGMDSHISVQAGDQLEKGPKSAKKARGGKLRKENSYSSMESDSRSSNFVQGANAMTSNGRQSGRSPNYDEDFSDDGQNGDRHINEEAQITFSKNEVDSEHVSHEDLAVEKFWRFKEGKADDCGRDALVECIMPLRLAEEALEREVRKLMDVGKEDILSSDDLVQPSMRNQHDNHLQTKLDEAQVMVALKNVKISELESTLNLRDLKNEHEELLMDRITAELEYLVISKTIQNLKVDQINLISQHKNLAAAEEEEDAERYKLQNMVCRYTCCFTVELVLLLVVVYLLVLRFWSQTIEATPT